MGILDLRESQSLRFPFNPWTTKMRSRHTSLSEQLEAQGFKLELELPEIISKGIIEPEIEHVEDISPEEENAILANMERRASQAVRRNSENWLASQSSAITQPFDMKNMKFNRRLSEQRNFSNRRSSANWVDSNSSVISKPIKMK